LGEAVRGNEALREQMEVQRLDAQAAGDRDLRLCREMYERRMETQAHNHTQAHADLGRQVKATEESLGVKAGQLQVAQEGLKSKSRARDALQREALVWKAQYELAEKMRADVERELVVFRQDCLEGELRHKQEEHDELARNLSKLEERREIVLQEARELERSAKAKESADAEEARSLAEQRQEAEQELQRAKANLAEAENSLASSRAEVATMMQQMSERRDDLQQQLQRLSADADADRRELERKVQAERIACEGFRESLQRLQDEHHACYRAACDRPVQQISALEGSISSLQRTAESELGGLRRNSEKLRARAEELEAELTRAQTRLVTVDKELQDGTACIKLAKAGHRAAKEALERELGGKTEELQQVRRSVAKKTEQLKSSAKAGEDLRRRLLREVEDARAARSRQAAETNSRLGVLRLERSPALEDVKVPERPRGRSLAAPSSGVVGLLREYEHPRSLQSMEERAADLRRGLQQQRSHSQPR